MKKPDLKMNLQTALERLNGTRTLVRRYHGFWGCGLKSALRDLISVPLPFAAGRFLPGFCQLESLPEHGFYQHGRFASNYRQFFGELPSETLRKASGSIFSPLSIR